MIMKDVVELVTQLPPWVHVKNFQAGHLLLESEYPVEHILLHC